jgi:hypothetical protein
MQLLGRRTPIECLKITSVHDFLILDFKIRDNHLRNGVHSEISET